MLQICFPPTTIKNSVTTGHQIVCWSYAKKVDIFLCLSRKRKSRSAAGLAVLLLANSHNWSLLRLLLTDTSLGAYLHNKVLWFLSSTSYFSSAVLLMLIMLVMAWKISYQWPPHETCTHSAHLLLNVKAVTPFLN